MVSGTIQAAKGYLKYVNYWPLNIVFANPISTIWMESLPRVVSSWVVGFEQMDPVLTD